MKKSKLFYILSAVLVLITVLSVTAFAVQPGDVDADGKITASDARIALRYSVGLEILTPDGVFRTDVDSDGIITSSDARTILRISVGLAASRYISNQYDMIRSGVFDYFGERLDTATGKYEYFELARTPETVHLLTTFENVDIAIFIRNDTVYAVSHDKKMYLITPDEVFSAIGMSKDELLGNSINAGAAYPSLNDAYSKKTANVEGFSCSVYLMKTEKGTIEAALCGNRLVRVREFDKAGKLTGATKFYSVSMVVPSHKKAIPADYKKYEGKLQAIAFVKELVS